MHEMSLAQNIIEILDEVLREHPEYHIQKVSVDIGELIAVVPESLEFCYTAITQGSPLEGSELNINIVPIQVFCRPCQKEFQLDSFLFICPQCGGTDLEEISGRELLVKNIDVNLSET